MSDVLFSNMEIQKQNFGLKMCKVEGYLTFKKIKLKNVHHTKEQYYGTGRIKS